MSEPLKFLDINGLRTFYNNIKPRMFYAGTCDTGGGFQQKNVVIPNFELRDGVRIVVTFSEQNTVANPTISVGTYELINDVLQFQGISQIPIYDTNTRLPLTGEEIRSISGTCEFIFSATVGTSGGAWLLLSNRQKNIFIYSEERPTSILEGMVWLKPWGAEIDGNEQEGNGGDS